MASRDPRCRAGLPVLLVCLVAIGCAGRDRGALPAGAREIGTRPDDRGGVKVDAVQAFVGLGYLFTDEEQSESDIERTEHILQERIGVGASGSVYTPGFLRYELAGIFGPSQDWAEDAQGSDFDTGELYEGFADISLFPTRMHPARFYFSRIEDFQPRVFFSKLESTTTTIGATQDVRSRDWGVQFLAERREFEQTVFATQEDPFVDITENTLGVSGDYRLSDYQTVTGSYQFVDVDQRESENSFESHNFLASHVLYFDEERRHDLRSRFEAVSQDGSLDQELLRWTESLGSRLTDTLQADANVTLERNDTNILKLEQITADAGLRHQLYESLSSSVRFQGGISETDDVSTTENYGATLGLDYRKKTGVGVFRMNYNGFVERRVSENDQGGAIDEPHTFPGVPPEEVRLFRPFIDLSSIVVTDTTGTVFYQRGIDYTLTQDNSSFTTITRVFSGAIPIGGSVLVDYTFRSGSDFTLDTLNQRVRAEHEFENGITPYVAFAHQDQNISDLEGPGGIEPIREKAVIGGIEWRGDWFLLGAEFEDRESTVLPFEAVRINGQATTTLEGRHSLTGSATQSWIFFDQPRRDVAATQGTARWRSVLGADSSFYVDAAVRYDDDSLVGSSFGFSISSGLEYRWRQFRFSLRAVHRETRGVTSDFRGDEVGIRVVREFGSPVRPLSAAVERFLRQ